MPRRVQDIREFLRMVRRPDAKSVCVLSKRAKNKYVTKFKLRCSRYLYTCTFVGEKAKADRIEASLPPTLSKTVIKSKKK